MRGKLFERDCKAVSADDGRVEPMRDLAKLLERGRDLPPRLSEALARFRIASELLLELVQLERQCDEPLLGAVVEVALQALSFRPTGLDDPRPRPAQLFEPSPQLGVEVCVFERDARPPR